MEARLFAVHHVREMRVRAVRTSLYQCDTSSQQECDGGVQRLHVQHQVQSRRPGLSREQWRGQMQNLRRDLVHQVLRRSECDSQVWRLRLHQNVQPRGAELSGQQRCEQV